MAKRPTLTDVTNILTSSTAINNNWDEIQTAFDNTLSRDGSSPNNMEADLDMNSRDLLNVDRMTANQIIVGGVDITDTPGGSAAADAAASAVQAQQYAAIAASTALVRPESFGAVGDGVTDDSVAVAAFFDSITSLGSKGYISGTYLMNTAYANDNVTKDIHLVFEGNGGFISGNYSDAVIQLKGDASKTRRFTIEGMGKIDTSASIFSEATASGTGIALTRFYAGEISGMLIRATQDEAEDWNNWRIAADSGISAIDIDSLHFRNCWFEGMTDTGIYPSGNSSNAVDTDDGGFCTFTDCRFHNCWGGIDIKREMAKCVIDRCYFTESRGGVAVVEVNTVFPARDITISNSKFHMIGWRPIRIMSRGRPARVVNCDFVDWGYDRDGTTQVGPGYAIIFAGVQGGEISGNRFSRENWGTFTGQSCIRYEQYVAAVDASVYDAKNNRHDNNTVIGINTFISEDSNAGPNTGSDNMLIGVTTSASFATGNKSWVGFVTSAISSSIVYNAEGDDFSINLNGFDLRGARGSFTPTVDFGIEPEGGVSYSSQLGRWERFGNQVTVHWDVTFTATWSVTGPAGHFRVPSNLPYSMHTDVNGSGSVGNVNTDFPADPSKLTVEIPKTTSYVQYTEHASEGSQATLSGLDVAGKGSGTSIRIAGSVTYLTDEVF